ncbi:MAG TPA: PAS domain S-box protein, partial [Rhodoferax sp.]|nr:PAS domain S-box protein [Rhodoferax sp.]
MPLSDRLLLPNALQAKPLQRLKAWWSRLTPQRQDRFAMLAPLAAVLLFLVAILSAFAYLRLEEISREREAINRDVEYTQQRLRLRLLEQQEQLGRFAREVASREISHKDFMGRAESLTNLYPELQGLTWIDDRRRVRVDYHTAHLPTPPQKTGETADGGTQGVDNFALAHELLVPIYSTPQARPGMDSTLELHLPLIEKARFKGTLLAQYSIDAMFRYGIPNEINAKYAISLHDAQGKLLAGSTITEGKLQRHLLPWASPVNAYEMPVSPIGNGLTLRGQAYRTSLGVIGSGLFWLVMVLSAITAWLLLANWSHTRRRIQAQDALVQETAFRRAMENSMLTGMRALDLQGRITYVNAAFCQMTGWSEDDLVGKTAPFPYWPDDDFDLLEQRLNEELSGKVLPSGIQFRIKRKDGSFIDARLYVSPLIDAFGVQTGWMTSMTDITEPNRVREQLAASYDRFTTVLEALDASISVAPLG